jgi:hypothetical protein
MMMQQFTDTDDDDNDGDDEDGGTSIINDDATIHRCRRMIAANYSSHCKSTSV